MRTKMFSIIFFAVIISMFFPFLMGQLQSQTKTPQLLISSASFPALIAKEEEVNQFFDNYEALYNRKDIDGFLSLFSSKAVQNHKDGIENIRRIYTLDVKGSYEIDQLDKSGKRKAWSGSIQWVLTREDGVLKVISVDYQAAK
jgi:hypothetical protein